MVLTQMLNIQIHQSTKSAAVLFQKKQASNNEIQEKSLTALKE